MEEVQARPAIALNKVESTSIAGYGYDSGSGLLRVQFKNGKSYDYSGVPESIVADLEKAESKGSFINRNIVRSFDSVKVGAA